MASGRVRVYLDDGIASIKYATVDAYGERNPSSGYLTTSSNLSLASLDHLYVASCTLESGYELPWEATYSGDFADDSVLPDSGTSSTVNINVYPQDGSTATVRLSATSVSYDSIDATIVLNGIEEVRLKYVAPDGIEYTIYFDGSENPLEIKPSSDIEILSITSFSNGYSSPVYAQGTGDPWDISTDNLLEFGSRNKTFTLSATQEKVYDFPFTIYTYVDGTRVSSTNSSVESSTTSADIDVRDYVNSAYFSSDYNYLGYSYSLSGTKYSSYTADLTADTAVTIYVWFEIPKPICPYRIYVYCDGDRINDYDVSSSTNTDNPLDLSDVLNSSLFEDYEFDYYTKGSSNTKYSDYTSVSLTANSTVTIYVYFITPTCTVTFQHYYLDSPSVVRDTTTADIILNTTIYPINYTEVFSHYSYSYATNSSGTKITSLKITSNVTVKLYYALVSYTVTFRHMLGDTSTQETTSSIKAKTTITLKNYAGSYSGYIYDHAEDSDNNTVSTLYVTEAVTIYLFYKLSTVTITYSHCRGKKEYTTTSETVNYGSTITVSNKKITSIPNCVYDHASSTTITATSNQTVKLYYAYKWTYAKTKGVEFNLTATEWNNLIAFVNDQRTSNYSFTSAVKGNDFTAIIYNQMVAAIGAGTTVSKGDAITATLMNAIVTDANSMAGL